MPAAIAIWICFCAYLNCAGWALSAIHELNTGGYVVTLTVGFAALLLWPKKNPAKIQWQIRWKKILRRFRKKFPLAFLTLATMALVGGVLYPPTNYDGLTYRVPRILHWLAAGHWEWIHAVDQRVNNRSCGIEWVSAPFVALFKTDRFLFLINIISLLLLPGLVFSLFTRLGVKRLVAWHWMWIVPTGYCFLLQAGSIGNDLFGVPFALAAVDFALRAKNSRSPRDLFVSILAAAMLTSAKTGNLPLLLPWAIAIFPSLKIVFRRPATTIAVCVLAIFASALPTIFFNAKFSGDWSGAGLNRQTDVKNAVLLLTTANAALCVEENLAPPIFPSAEKFNRALAEKLPAQLSTDLGEILDSPGSQFALDQMQIEENAGVGFGVSALLLASALAAIFYRKKKTSQSKWLICVRWSPLISLFSIFAVCHLSPISRLLAANYALLIPIPLANACQARVVKKLWWRAAAFMVFFIAALLLIVSPARPLFPAQTILETIRARGTNSNLLARMNEVYSVYRNRNDAFATVRDILPPDLKVLGFVTFDDPETSLWRPFGTRRIDHVCPQDTAMDLKSRGIEYVLVKSTLFGNQFPGTFDEWLKKMNAQIIRKIPLNLRASAGPLDWYLVKLN